MRKLVVLSLVALFVLIADVALPAPEQSSFTWTDLGGDPYIGGPAKAIQLLPIPSAVQLEFIEMVGTGLQPGTTAPREGRINRGDELPWMVFGKGTLRRNVTAGWKSNIQWIPTKDWVVTHQNVEYTLKYPESTCRNWALTFRTTREVRAPMKEPPAQPQPKTAPAPQSTTAIATVPEQTHTIRIRLWEAGDISKQLATEAGLQSRDLGAYLRAAAREGKVKPMMGTYPFKIEFAGGDLDKLRGRIIHQNGHQATVPAAFAGTLEIAVVNGEGTLVVPVSWIATGTTIAIHSPWKRPDIFYPPSGRLSTTATSPEGQLCGRSKDPKASEFWNLAHLCGSSNYHFAK